MPRILTWNIYHGTFAPPSPTPAGLSPMNRLAYIANIALANGVDILCLQEVPTADLDPAVGFGVCGAGVALAALGGVPGFAANFTYLQGSSENNPNPPQATVTTDGYLILYRNATFPGGHANLGFYNDGHFTNLYGASLRPPIIVDLIDGAGTTTQVLNWHAETGAGAGWSLEILDALLGNANNYMNDVVMGGDFNVRGNFATVFGGVANFTNWTNLFAVYPGGGGAVISGLDHLLTSVNCHTAIGGLLHFTSDAYHYPIAADY